MLNESRRFNTYADLEARYGNSTLLLTQGFLHLAEGSKSQEQVPTFPKVLYIDGITSAGKTTLQESLMAEMPDAEFVEEFSATIPEKYRNANPGTLLRDHLRAQFWFYRQYVMKNEEIKQKSGKVIVDRGLMGLFAYSNLVGENREVSCRVILNAMQKVWVPGLYVFLTATPEVVKERLIKRQDSAHIEESDWDKGLGAFIIKLHQSIEEVAKFGGITLIDTSDKSPEQVKSQVMELFDAYLAT